MPVHGGPTSPTEPLADYRLTCRLIAPLPLAEVFRAFENAHNLARITPPWLNFRVVTGQLEMRAGAEIDYVIRWMGLPMRWKTLIDSYDPPRAFTDTQLRGPYALWHHRHEFASTPAGTLVVDRVDYRLPFGALGRLAHAVMVKRQLLAIFRYRQSAMADLLGVTCTPLDEPRIDRVRS